jgi:pimeloyl-ACP methyl ester carboxylesterase
MKLIAAALLLAGSLLAHTAKLDGIDIHWESAGKGKKTVVLVHGWTGDMSVWDAQVPALSKKYRVLLIDLPGHGKSALPKDNKFSMDLFARAIEAVRADAKAKDIVLVGHSLGTPVIRQYARLFPQHTLALVLVDGVVIKAESAQMFLPLVKTFEGPGGAAARDKFVRNMFTKAPPEIQPGILKVSNATSEAAAVGAFGTMTDPAIWKEDIIDIPVLGIYAEKSTLATQFPLKRIFPKIEYIEIPGTDHFLMLEKPAEFNRVLLTFLDNLHF